MAKNLKNCIDKINSFSDIYKITENYTAKEKGDLFEELTKYIFLYHHSYRTFTKNVWLFNDIPPSLLKKLNMPKKDQGIDLILLDNYGKYHSIQSKFRSDTNEVISWSTISTFYGLTYGVATGFSGGFYVTNTNEITQNAKQSKNIVPTYGSFFNDIPKTFFDELKEVLLKQQINKTNVFAERDYQKTIINKTIEHFKDNSRGYLSMICGSGKTLTSYMIDKNMKNKTTICVVPSLYLLSQFANDWAKEDGKSNFMLVGSDADVDDIEYENNGLIITTDPEIISNNILTLRKKKKECKITIITTYQSSDKLIEALKSIDLEPDLCILDEAHKTVGQVGKQFNLLLDDKNLKIKKRLFMTATPKIFIGEIDNEKILSMNDEKWYGKQIYSYSASDAIKDGYLCDYKIISMASNDSYIKKVIQDNKNLIYDKKISKSHYISSGIMILNSFKSKDCNHMITYHNSIAASKNFKLLLDKLCKIYKMKITILQIDGDHSMKERTKIIREFSSSDMSILVSSKVLNEGINIPIVDSISFIDCRSSTIDIIQCIGRALRLHERKKLAKIYIPVFIDDMNCIEDCTMLGNVIKILRALSETDSKIEEQFKVNDKNDGGGFGKFMFNGQYCSSEKTGEDFDIGKWINNIETKMWDRIKASVKVSNRDKKTAKKIEGSKDILKTDRNNKKYNCDCCGKIYINFSFLNKHRQICKEKEELLKKQEYEHNDKINKIIIDSLNDKMAILEDNIEFKNRIIKEKDKTSEQRDRIINNQNSIIEQRDRIINNQNSIIEQRDRIINNQNSIIEQRDKTIEDQNEIIEQLKSELEKYKSK